MISAAYAQTKSNQESAPKKPMSTTTKWLEQAKKQTAKLDEEALNKLINHFQIKPSTGLNTLFIRFNSATSQTQAHKVHNVENNAITATYDYAGISSLKFKPEWFKGKSVEAVNANIAKVLEIYAERSNDIRSSLFDAYQNASMVADSVCASIAAEDNIGLDKVLTNLEAIQAMCTNEYEKEAFEQAIKMLKIMIKGEQK